MTDSLDGETIKIIERKFMKLQATTAKETRIISFNEMR